MGVFLSNKVHWAPFCGWVSRSFAYDKTSGIISGQGTHLVPWMLLGILSPAVWHLVCSSFPSHCALCCSQLICILATLSNYRNPREADTRSKDIHFFQNTLFHKRMSLSTLPPTVYTMSISSSVLFSNMIYETFICTDETWMYTQIFTYIYTYVCKNTFSYICWYLHLFFWKL